MEYFIKNSFIINNIFKFLIFIYNKFKESGSYSFFNYLASKIKNHFSHSSIYSYLRGPEYLDEIWSNSRTYSLLSKLFNGPSIFFRKVYEKHENLFEHSYGFKLLNIVLSRFEIVIGFVLIFTFIIPDHRWYNAYGVVLTLILSLLFFMKTIMKKDNLISIGSLDFTFIIFMVAITMATITSLFPADSINYYIYYLVTFITLLIIVNSVRDTKDLNTIIELIVIGVFITALYGIWQWKVVGIEVNPSLTDIKVNQGMSGRVFSTMGNPNIYGELLVLTIPLFGVVVLNTKNIWKKLFFTFLLIPVIVILFKTGSRSAWVSFAFSLFVFVFFKNRKLIPFMLLGGILAIPLLPPSIYRRIMTIFNPNDTSVKYRKEILEPAIPMLKNYWSGGVGLGNDVFNTIYKRYKSFRLKTVAHTHNLYLQIWLEAGIVALGSFLWLIFRLIKKSSIAIFNKEDENLNNILIGSLSSIAGLMLMGFADHVWFYNRILFTFWIIIGLIFAALKLLNIQNPTKKTLSKS